MYLYFNNLRELPNFGCRTTGMALEELLKINNMVERFDALESVNWSGIWDNYARGPLKYGGLIPRKFYDKIWMHRNEMPRTFYGIRKVDEIFGGKHDYITKSPSKSFERYLQFSQKNKRIAKLSESLNQCDGVIINGEGTLIFGNPTLRDALYLLFIIYFAKKIGKPVYLLNAMIAPCPYNGEDPVVLRHALPLLESCELIALREERSYAYLEKKIGRHNLTVIPDALFTWKDRIKSSFEAVQSEPQLCAAYPQGVDTSDFRFDRPYICISGSSSAWRYRDKISSQFTKLLISLKKLGYPIYCIETCDGDFFLRDSAKASGTNFISKSSPVMAAAGILAGSHIYITGRYHPAIMASANGVPCIFLTSNSHKTSSIQQLLGYQDHHEYSVCPTNEEIDAIIKSVENISQNRAYLSTVIVDKFNTRRDEAMRYASILQNNYASE